MARITREHAELIKHHGKDEAVLERIRDNFEQDPHIDAESWTQETGSPLEYVEDLDDIFIQAIKEEGERLNELNSIVQSIDEEELEEGSAEEYWMLEDWFEDILEEHNQAFHRFYDTDEDEWLKPLLVYELLEKGPEDAYRFVEGCRDNLETLEEMENRLEELGEDRTDTELDSDEPGDADTGTDPVMIEPVDEPDYTTEEDSGYELGLMEKVALGAAKAGDFLNYGGDDR